MAAYRFCRTDDIGLLTDALNRCWSPYFPDEPATTPATFKQSIRDRQVWCSSCMVAFAGAEPIGVLIGAKRASGTLIHKIAVHPDHRRQEHGRHLLTSLGSKLAILGPPRIVAEVPESLGAARALFSASGFVEEASLIDYVLPDGSGPLSERAVPTPNQFMIPVTVDDLVANGVLGASDGQTCWTRSVETLTARKDRIAGLAIASDERIEAYVLHETPGDSERGDTASAATDGADMEIVALRSCVDDDGGRLSQLLTALRHRRPGTTLRFSKVHPAEFSPGFVETLGFRPGARHLLFAAAARAN
jgi:GNAT superfamily N-acetyltransferase